MTAIIIPRMKFRIILRLLVVLPMMVMLLTSSVSMLTDLDEQVRTYTRAVEFDYLSWTLDALGLKIGQTALGAERYLEIDQRPEIVLEYLDLVGEIWVMEATLEDIYADPNISDPFTVSAELRADLEQLYVRRSQMQMLAEEIVQDQINTVATEMGLTLTGQTIPPVLYHVTPLPMALIISPRDVIRQDADISVSPDLTIDQITEIESRVDKDLNVSSLVTNVGGIGLYPSMVMQTTSINQLAEVVSHEWVHNFLTLRPLGMSYGNSPQLRTVNETVANMAGKELGQAVIARFYPEYLPKPPVPTPTPAPPGSEPTPQPTSEPPAFNFNAEMHTTRLEVDRLLAEGKVEEAEAYMEQRRIFFWENGYHIRKLNQAYFAFHGAYADEPGGAAGASENPVGDAVRSLRANSTSLAEFLNRISWMWTFEQLERAVSQN